MALTTEPVAVIGLPKLAQPVGHRLALPACLRAGAAID